MLISFETDGSVDFTRNPDALALFEGERVSITRMSDILHDEALQAHYIQFRTGPFAGLNLAACDDFLWADFVLSGQRPVDCICGIGPGMVLVFKTYEDAVRMEIAYIDFLRGRGCHFA